MLQWGMKLKIKKLFVYREPVKISPTEHGHILTSADITPELLKKQRLSRLRDRIRRRNENN